MLSLSHTPQQMLKKATQEKSVVVTYTTATLWGTTPLNIPTYRHWPTSEVK